jgi:hypothetical protein
MLCGVSPTTLTNKLLQAHNGIAQTLSNGNTTDRTLIPNTENLQRKRLPEEDKCTSNKAEVNEGKQQNTSTAAKKKKVFWCEF